MAKQRPVWILPGIVVSLLFTAVGGFACTCVGAHGAKTMRDVAVWYSEGSNAGKVIFEGSVEKQELKAGTIGAPSNAMSMTTSGAHRAVSISVLRSYRGQAIGNVIVLTGVGGGDCGFDFQTGKQYLVYADRISPESLFTSICTGTSPVEHAGPALRLLRGEAPSDDDLLDPESYYKKFGSQWTGTACGRVSKPDGSPVDKASVEMTQVRDEPLPPMSASDPDLSKPDGSFCVQYITPGKYLLTAEKTDYDADIRWMGYYPGVAKHSEAVPIEVHAGDNLADLRFTVRRQSVYTVSFRIVTPDGSPLPLERLGVSIDSPERDALSYHLTQNRSEEGYYTVGYVPPGRYLVRTYIQPDFTSGKVPAELSKWRMAKQEVEIQSDSEIVLKLSPVN